MLKITSHPHPDRTVLQLEGAITGPWIDELRLHLQPKNQPIDLDLAGITYMDQHATRLIEESLEKGTKIVACSHFAALMLQQNPTEF